MNDHYLGNQPRFHLQTANDQIEALIAMLTVHGREYGAHELEITNDVLGSSRVAARHYMTWMEGQRLIFNALHNQGRYFLTDEGWCALLMLKATRPEELIDVEPGGDAVRLAGGPEMAGIANPEVNVAGARFWFTRDRLAGSEIISLIDREGKRGRMPMQKTVWSCAFGDAMQRDRMFEWLCVRSDRWQDWGAIAGRGADTLTQHLLDIYVASIDWRDPQERRLLTHGAA